MRRMAKQKIELQEVKSEAEINDTPVEESPQVKKSKRGKGKQPVTYPSRPKTRPKNKLRLNSKAMFKPSLKKDNLIIIDEDVTEEVLKKTAKGKKQLPQPDIDSSHSEEDSTYVPEMYDLPKFDIQEIQSLSKSAEKKTFERSSLKEIIKGSPSNEHKYEMRPRKPKLSIDLNRPASEEDCGGCQAGTGDVSTKQKIKKLQAVIKKSTQKIRLVSQNAQIRVSSTKQRKVQVQRSVTRAMTTQEDVGDKLNTLAEAAQSFM
jgi:hypothetical protein